MVADPLVRWGRPKRLEGTVERPLIEPPGYGRRHGSRDREIKVGNLTVVVEGATPKRRPSAIRERKRGERPRGADEAVISEEGAGQNNPIPS